MNLREALEALQQPLPANAASFRGALACGFTPLHLQTFLRAYLSKRFSEKRVQIETGLFGDLVGNVERLLRESPEALFVAVEWPDLDPRLGIRTLGGWRPSDLPDIVNSAAQAIARLETALSHASGTGPVCVSMPTLPLPPLFTSSPHEASADELRLRQMMASFACAMSGHPGVRVLSSQLLDELSPARDRFDVKSEVQTGFPYRLPHASILSEVFAESLAPPTPRKGLITDLDDTLWAGILGEVGTEGISWSLDRHTHLHGVYQQFLASLASAGILIGVASKNEMEAVHGAFERRDLRIPKENIFPFEVHWSRKSESVRRILQAWNIGADAVVFLDDSPMEVAEVQAAFPEMDCRVFPAGNHEAVWSLLRHLRQAFGKRAVSEEDLIRLESLRGAGALHNAEASSGCLDDFLQSAAASVRVEFNRNGRDARAFELLNKTNQFNLNGKRLTEAGWLAYFADPAAFLMTVTYEDKYGPLGKIAALLGTANDCGICVDYWVMSCRAFSRRIEHLTLRHLLEKFMAPKIVFDFLPTPRNAPLQEFFSDLHGTPAPAGYLLSRAEFASKSFALFQRVEEIVND